jgi:hypothetical protein
LKWGTFNAGKSKPPPAIHRTFDRSSDRACILRRRCIIAVRIIMQPASKYVVHSGHLMETLGFHPILTGFELFNPIVSCSSTSPRNHMHMTIHVLLRDGYRSWVSFFLSMANSEAVTG